MSPIRVLIVDDAVVVRRMLSDVLSKDPEIEVVGTASDGAKGLKKLDLLTVDAMVLDVEMPVLDGLQVLEEMRRRGLRTPTIMFSSLTERGAVATIEALARGATDYVAKPSGTRNSSEAVETIRDDLIPKIKAAVGRKGRSMLPAQLRRAPVAPAAAKRSSDAAISLLAIGASTGGPNALSLVVGHLAGNFPVPVLITQHMPAMFTKFLAERLDSGSPLKVVEAEDGMVIEAGKVFVAPGGYHLTVATQGASRVVQLDQGPPENSCRPAVDVMFRSVAEAYGSGVLAVVLTGMGQDGMRGAQVIRQRGGRVFAQDEHTSVVWGMPGFVVRNDLAEKVLAIGDVAGEITSAVTTSQRRFAAGSR